MRYCVLIKISKQRLCFWYQIENSDFAPLSLKDGSDIPLYFYVSGNDFIVGHFARERHNVNDRNAYQDYFSLIQDPSKYFVLHGDSKPIKQLLYYGIENYLSHFIKTILFKNESIEAYRVNFCLRFWFNDDISKPERYLVENLFKEAGYENVKEIDSSIHINKVISEQSTSNRSRLFLSSVNNDLYIKLFNYPKYTFQSQYKLEELGSDPRAKILAKLILEDIKEASPHIFFEEDKELIFILNHCADLLKNLSPIMRNKIELSTGVTTDYKIRFRDLEDRMIYSRGIEDKVIPKLDQILNDSNQKISSVDVILLGDEINTEYFIEKLKKRFPYVLGVPSIVQQKILKSIFISIASFGYNLKNENAFVGDKILESDISSFQEKPISSYNADYFNPASAEKKPAPLPIPNSSNQSKSPPLPPLPGANTVSPLPLHSNANKNIIPPPPMPGGSPPLPPPPIPGGIRAVTPPPLPKSSNISNPVNSVSSTTDVANKKKLETKELKNDKKSLIPPPPPPPPKRKK